MVEGLPRPWGQRGGSRQNLTVPDSDSKVASLVRSSLNEERVSSLGGLAAEKPCWVEKEQDPDNICRALLDHDHFPTQSSC